MKKIITALLAVLMMCSMSMTASAETKAGTGDSSADVTASYIEGDNGSTIYSVDITWGAMEFTFKDESEGTWNPATHEYENAAESEWTASGNTVTVTNHSNTAVDVSFAYNKETGYEAVDGSLDVTSENLATAVGTEVSAAPNVTSTLTLSGELPSGTPDGSKVGTVVVTIE